MRSRQSLSRHLLMRVLSQHLISPTSALRISGAGLVLACLALMLGFSPAWAASKLRPLPRESSVVYASVDECIISKLLNEAECRRAWVNAAAEFREKAPHFPTRESCVQAFSSCSLAAPDPASAAPAANNVGKGKGAKAGLPRLEYVPQFGRVKIIVQSMDMRMAMPVLPDARSGLLFKPRSVSADDSEFSQTRANAARAGWHAAAAREPSAAQAGGYNGKGEPVFVDTSPNDDSSNKGPVASYPMPAGQWERMQQKAKSLQSPR